jgi:hypothetical protein
VRQQYVAPRRETKPDAASGVIPELTQARLVCLCLARLLRVGKKGKPRKRGAVDPKVAEVDDNGVVIAVIAELRDGVWWSNPDFKPTVYAEFEGSPAWAVVDKVISDLVENQDLVEQTHRHYIVGYTVKALSEAELLAKR